MPKTIQIFIPDGNPKSVRIIDDTSRLPKAVIVPRAKLDMAANRDELKNVGVYFLVGHEGDDLKDQLYIGEAEDCLTRLKQHNKEKDFWDIVIVVISKTQHFTKAHIKYLENHCYEEALKSGRYRLVNSNKPKKSHLPESAEADLLDNFDTIKLLLSTLGYSFFDVINKPAIEKVLTCKGKSAFAEGEYLEDGLVVFTGSKCNIDTTPTFPKSSQGLRTKLEDEGILKVSSGVLRFASDYAFSSPSAASDVILGRSSNGWSEWKYRDGKTLNEVIRQKR